MADTLCRYRCQYACQCCIGGDLRETEDCEHRKLLEAYWKTPDAAMDAFERDVQDKEPDECPFGWPEDEEDDFDYAEDE